MVHILGGGVAGLGAAYRLNEKEIEATVFEQRSRWGGLLDNFTINEFLFDYCVHFSFTKTDYVNQLFQQSTDFYRHKPESINFYNDVWLRHPAQNNLFPLPVEEKIKIIKSFIERTENFDQNQIKNYDEWLRIQYGNYFAENFPGRYTRKYWTVEANDLETKWVGKRMYRPNVDEVLRGAMSTETPNTYYTKEMRYPKQGGYKSFIRLMAQNLDIRTNKKAVGIDTAKQRITFSDGTTEHYEQLISTLPLPEIVKLLADVPAKIRDAAQQLLHTSVELISVGFSRPDVPPALWFYIYDEDILPARAYSPSRKAPANVPDGKSSLQFELYHSNLRPLQLTSDDLKEHIVTVGKRLNLFLPADIELIDVRRVPYGNVVFEHNIYRHREMVRNFLNDKNILTAGRFGEWDYLWSDQSLMSGKHAADTIIAQRTV